MSEESVLASPVSRLRSPASAALALLLPRISSEIESVELTTLRKWLAVATASFKSIQSSIRLHGDRAPVFPRWKR